MLDPTMESLEISKHPRNSLQFSKQIDLFLEHFLMENLSVEDFFNLNF